MTTPAATPPASPTSPLIRPAIALLAGLGIIVVIVAPGTFMLTVATFHGSDPKQFHPGAAYLAGLLVLTVAGALGGGFATSRITFQRSFFTVFVLALLLFVSGVVPVLRGAPAPVGQPDWFPLAQAILNPICVLIGGFLERRRTRALPMSAAQA